MMRRIQMMLLLVLLCATTTFAQRGHARGGEMLDGLELTAEQQEQIDAIRKDTRTQMQALRKEAAATTDNREQAQALRKKSKDAVMAVLTPEQRAELEAKAKARKEAWKAVDKDAMRAELKAYRQEKMEPVLRASRGQLDQYIAAEDQTEIERLRTVFADKPKQGRRGGKGKRGGKQADKEDSAENAQNWRTEHAADIASLQALSKKYATELERVEKVLGPQRETWRKEMSAIKDKYLPEDATRPGKRKGPKGKARKGGKKEGQADRPREDRDSRRGAAFLLRKS